MRRWAKLSAFVMLPAVLLAVPRVDLHPIQRGIFMGQNVPAPASGPTVHSVGCYVASNTTTSFSSVGYTGEVVMVTFYPPQGSNTTTDSLGNTLSDLTVYGSGPAVKVSYSPLSTTSSSTTISLTNAGVACIFLTTGLTLTPDSGTDQGNTSNTGTTCQPDSSSITPGSNHVVFTAEGGSVNQSSSPAPTIGNSGTDAYVVSSPIVLFNPGTTFGEAAGYAILTGASNLTWNWDTPSSAPCIEASFH